MTKGSGRGKTPGGRSRTGSSPWAGDSKKHAAVLWSMLTGAVTGKKRSKKRSPRDGES